MQACVPRAYQVMILGEPQHPRYAISQAFDDLAMSRFKFSDRSQNFCSIELLEEIA